MLLCNILFFLALMFFLCDQVFRQPLVFANLFVMNCAAVLSMRYFWCGFQNGMGCRPPMDDMQVNLSLGQWLLLLIAAWHQFCTLDWICCLCQSCRYATNCEEWELVQKVIYLTYTVAVLLNITPLWSQLASLALL